MGETFLSRDEIMNIPQEFMPLAVLSDKLRSFLSWGIKAHEHGCYNHFMWLYKPGELASQGLSGFRNVKLESYLDDSRLKLWHCSGLLPEERLRIIVAIKDELAQPWYKNMYDVLAYPGQLLGWHWLQVPGMEICSDKSKYLALVDPTFDLKYPDPEQVNTWLTEHPERYSVYGRYTPD